MNPSQDTLFFEVMSLDGLLVFNSDGALSL